MHQLGGRITYVTGERRATEFLLERLSAVIPREKASCVLNTCYLSWTLCTIYNLY